MLVFYLAFLGFWGVGCTDDFFFQGKSKKNKWNLGIAKTKQVNNSVMYLIALLALK